MSLTFSLLKTTRVGQIKNAFYIKDDYRVYMQMDDCNFFENSWGRKNFGRTKLNGDICILYALYTFFLNLVPVPFCPICKLNETLGIFRLPYMYG